MRYFFLRLYYQTFFPDRLEHKAGMIPDSLALGQRIPAPNWYGKGQLRYLGDRWFLYEPPHASH